MSRLALAVLPLGLAAAAAAQTPNQTDAAPAVPIPAAPVITLPPAPAPTPAASATPAAPRTSAARSRPRANSAPRAPARTAATPTPVPSPTPTPSAGPTPQPSATPSAAPPATVSPGPTPSAAGTPASDLARTSAEAEQVENPRFWAAIVVALLALAAAGFLAWRWRQARRARLAEEELARQPQVTVAGAVPPPPPPAEAGAVAERPGSDVPTFWTPSRPASPPTGLAAPPAADEPPAPPPPLRPRVAMTLRPRRAGINLVSATADLELTVRNEGDGAAEAVAVSLRLLAGRAGQDEELGALFGTEQDRPVLPPFVLEPGAERVCRTTLVLPRAEIEPIPIKGRPMFVPVVAADVRYLRPDGGRGQTAAAFVIGAARPGSEKLAPFWLDVGSKMRDDVEARPHGLAIES